MKHKSIFLIAFLFFRASIINAQEIEWQNTIGGSGWEWLYYAEQTTDGGYICGGASNSGISGDKTEDLMGIEDYWLVKLDSGGAIVWQNTIGADNMQELTIIRQSSDGGYICGGFSDSDISGDKTEDSMGGWDYWIVKVDSLGGILWQNTLGGNAYETLFSIEETSDGGVICGGWSESYISGDKTEDNMGGDDLWIVKLDAGGNIQWQNSIGGSGNEYIYSIHQTDDGGYICGAYSSSGISGDKTETCLGQHDFWIIKLDGNGAIQWQNTIGGTGDDALKSIWQTSDGGYICGGSSFSGISGDKTENCLGSSDFWVVKLDGIGNIQWQNTIGGSLIDKLNSIQQTMDGGYICGGMSESDISGDKNENSAGLDDYWVVKLDSNGIILWQNSIGGSLEDELFSIKQTLDGGILCAGYSNSNISGDKTEMSMGDSDFWIVKLTEKYNLIQGIQFADLNSNTTKEINEPYINNKKITDLNSGRFTFTNSNGFYSLAVLDSGNFEVITDSSINYYVAAPPSYAGNFSGLLEIDSLNDFALQPTGVFNDLCITITAYSQFRSGMDAYYLINYINIGTAVLSPSVIFYPDSNLTFVTSNPVASSVAADSIIWNIGAIDPFQSGQILVTVNPDFSLINGTLINSTAVIEPISGDANPVCNQSQWEVMITGSFDPNIIMVSQDTLFDYELTNPPFLDYVICFQNTGNDTAFYVRLDNKITSDLNLNSFEFVASSHACNMEYQSYDSTMKFIFNNILLPDSNTNEAESHGFVRYKIKPLNTIPVGQLIYNYANIYFDYNSPVTTNTVFTEIVIPTGVATITSFDELKIYPIPTHDNIFVFQNIAYRQHLTVDIYDVFGQKVKSLYDDLVDAGVWEGNFDIRNLSAGIYFLNITGNISITKKVVKW